MPGVHGLWRLKNPVFSIKFTPCPIDTCLSSYEFNSSSGAPKIDADDINSAGSYMLASASLLPSGLPPCIARKLPQSLAACRT